MISDQRDNISMFDINQCIFFVFLQFKKNRVGDNFAQDNNFCAFK